MPEDYLALDGNSLSTDDLRQLGKGRYKIRITKGLSMSNYPKFYPISIHICFIRWTVDILKKEKKMLSFISRIGF